MTAETTNHVRCPHCKTAFRALPEHAGRRAKCSHCGGTIVVPGEPVKPPLPPGDPSLPQYVGVNCILCGTRMYGTLADVGKELKCPDCGRLTKLPPPEIKKKNIPAALEGEQYDIWEGDDQPWGVKLSSEGPEYVVVECRLCQTLLQATLDQVGKKIHCHDCGVENEVRLPATGARPQPKPAAPVDEYGVEEVSQVPSVSLASFYTTDAAEVPRQGGNARESKRATPLDIEFAERPKLPRWPLLVDNFGFLGSPGVPARVVTMALTLLVPTVLVALVFLVRSTIMAVIVLPPMVFFAVPWCAAMAAACMAIVIASSEGSSQVHDWPPPAPTEWLPELGYFIFALTVSAFPGWVVAAVSPELSQIGLLLMGASLLLFFPIVLLSQLAGGSVLAVWSPAVTMSWFRCPSSWLGFYFQSVALAALVSGTCLAVFALSRWFLLPLFPLAILAAFYYFRIMGRLAWVITESTPVSEEEDDDKKKSEPKSAAS